MFLGAPLPTTHALARIGLVDYYGRVFTANDPHRKPKEARKPHNSSRKRSAQTSTPTLQGPSTAPAGPILLKFWPKTRKSILNKVTKFQIPPPNRLRARIEKPPGEVTIQSFSPSFRQEMRARNVTLFQKMSETQFERELAVFPTSQSQHLPCTTRPKENAEVSWTKLN